MALVGLEPAMEVVAEVDRGDSIVAVAVAAQPDVAVLDIDLSGTDGLTAAVQRHTYRDGATCSHRSANPHTSCAPCRVGSLACCRRTPVDQLTHGIRQVAGGKQVLDPVVVAAALDTGASSSTERGTDVLRAAARGITVEETAAELRLSKGTVRNDRSNAIARLEARNRVGAMRIARSAGWLSRRSGASTWLPVSS